MTAAVGYFCFAWRPVPFAAFSFPRKTTGDSAKVNHFSDFFFVGTNTFVKPFKKGFPCSVRKRFTKDFFMNSRGLAYQHNFCLQWLRKNSPAAHVRALP